MKVRNNLVGGVIFLVLGIVLWFMIPYQIGMSFSASNYALSPRSVPYLLSIVMIFFSLILIIKSLVFKQEEIITIQLKDELRAFLFYLMVVVSILLMNMIGYLFAALLLGISTLLFMRIKKKSYYIYIGLFVVAVYVIFAMILKVRLP